MSRIVLRSKEGTKLPEQKSKLKPFANTPRTPSKKVDNRKSKSNINTKEWVQTCPKQLATDRTDEEKKNSQMSIICSLPLSRLTGIIEKLNIKSPSMSKCINSINSTDNVFNKPGKTANGASSIEDDESKKKDQDERQSFIDDDTSNSKSQDQLLVKTLCLYCDKKFSTHKMQQKHIEKFHISLKDRRCSVRNSQVQASPRNKFVGKQLERGSTLNTLALTNFPGCTYCKKTKSLEISDSAVIDFNGLFRHLTEYHADKYFGCKICIMRFQNLAKLLKHMQNVHNTLPDSQLKLTKDYNDTHNESNIELMSPTERHTRTRQRHGVVQHECTTSSRTALDQSSVIGAEEAILSRLGLTQNRRRNPISRKGVRPRRDTSVSDILIKNDAISTGSSAVSLVVPPSKSRSRTTTKSTNPNGDTDSVVFRMPARTDSLLTPFDESFYKEVTSNVRNNLLFNLDGKLGNQSHKTDQEPTEHQNKSLPLLLRSTLASNLAISEAFQSNLLESEIHVATNIPATTAFPTLLTTEQYCVDVTSAKIRRPHTKHSWKWKWDSVKKYKLINEGGKIVKKAKHPMIGLRDLSKLDMWTQLSMRQKHEKQLSLIQDTANAEECYSVEKRRVNDQLNSILDKRVLPHIILEQSEQAIIKLENDEFNFTSSYERHDDGDDFYTGSIVGQTFADETFLSLLQLMPCRQTKQLERKLVFSGEWARPRCYLCMCCGNKFEKLKSLEEHKMFRHSNILSTHYEVVGRELLAGNILQHLFIPKRALSLYNKANFNTYIGNSKSLCSYRRVNTSAEDESSDSIQSITNCYNMRRTYSLKHTNSTTDDCDTDTKTTLLGDMNTTVSPSHSLHSTFSSSVTPLSNLSRNSPKENKDLERKWKCSKCNRKCNSMPDLYRHMLDCSGDCVWSMAKKRKYRYYCGSKKRRPLHKQHLLESRKTKQEKPTKNSSLENCTTEESSSNSYKPKTPPRPRPSDAESIKKMLENLPPKRICKKIFPTVNKSKKGRKATFITKLYNTKVLRKTRARQISNGAKRAANTRFSVKSQLNTNALKTFRSKANQNADRSKPIKPSTISGINSNSTHSEKRNSPKKDLNSEEEKQESIMVEDFVPKANDIKDSLTTDKSQKREEEELFSESTSAQKVVSSSDTQEQQKSQLKKKSDVCVNKEPTNKSDSSVVAQAVEKVLEAPKTQRAENQVCNKKRSKRISDCIAMLTGKLEEKLKTEVALNSENQEVVDTESKTTSVEKEKKTPKRKAISRRIIKPDINDTTPSELDQQPKSVIPTTVPLIVTTETMSKKTATAKETVLPVAPVEIATPSAITSALVPNKTKPLPSKQVEIPTTTVAIPSQPATISVQLTTPPSTASTKQVLPSSIKPPAHVSIPSTLHAVPVPIKVLQSHLPVFIPVQQTMNAPTLPPTPPLSLAIQHKANTSPTLMPSVALLPPPPLLQAHVPPPDPSPLCSMEPLNLSNVKRPKKQTTAELRAQRPGIPARRQTISGFEARDLILFNDMEPLDLSKKSKELSARIPAPPLPQPSTVHVANLGAQNPITQVELLTTVRSAQMPSQNSLCEARIQINDSSTKPVNMVIAPTLPPETVFNKQFYSNLELLKIPQVRAAGFIAVNLPVNDPPNIVSNVSNANISATNNVHMLLKTNKKRNNSKASVEQTIKKQPPTPVVIETNKVKEHVATNKKESASKNKPITKMDEEVINHIDDAINSVINAVKASLPENDEDKVPPAKTAVNPPEPKVDHSVRPVNNIEKLAKEPIATIENSMPDGPHLMLTPKKRTLRSKTLDCRSELMRITRPPSITEVLYSPVTQQNNVHPTENNVVIELPTVRELTCEIINEKIEENHNSHTTKQTVKKEMTPKSIQKGSLTVTTHTKTPKKMEENTTEQNEEKIFERAKKKAFEKTKEKLSEASKGIVTENTKETFVEPTKENSSEKTKEKISLPICADLEKETQSTLTTAIDKKLASEPSLQGSNVNLTLEENMSNINNTSSGFHSSGTPDNAGDVKKKQRRRRKNELAAIVADQLLESFKIDKARRDSLKKLENLAYEKSEDLLLTGMLLMSSTKRNASSGINFAQNSTEKRVESTRRQKLETTGISQDPKTRAQSNENSNKNILPKAPSAVEEFNEISSRKSQRRRQSRRKATLLDNENLSKLKSSLESFSIGIEKQLSEIEARNTNVFNNSENRNRKSVEQTALKSTSSILRPSILSATLEQVDTQKNTVAENSKVPVSSRDPRLNKNIHKDERHTTLLSNEKNTATVCDLEDDNYLTEIAKNVNEKIMSAENEDFAFADDGFEIGNEDQDDSNSKFSRPPTSMSVRSAPNFNDDQSNFGSICDENTNTEVMDMDLDDELSVYTSFSQDLGRGKGRKKRRRRSILLKRRPKKRRASQDLTAEKFECELCKKTFFAATSLSKHNMTLAHVSKVSEREYLLSKSGKSSLVEDLTKTSANPKISLSGTHHINTNQYDNVPIVPVEKIMETVPKEPSSINNVVTPHRLSLNPDERLFFECCNILKSADTTRVVRGDNDNENINSFVNRNLYQNQTSLCMLSGKTMTAYNDGNINLLQKPMFEEKSDPRAENATKTQDAFRNPIVIPSSFNKLASIAVTTNERQIHSPTYTQFSVVTNTTSRFKTKAAMKGYENGNVHVTIPEESKSRGTCKLTELADIALGHDDKPRTPEMPPNLDQAIIGSAKRIITPDYVTLSVVDSRRNCNYNALQDNKKNTETQGSSSSRTIMHSSIIKAAVEEHSKSQPANKIVIPERPFKNIGLEEKESITFQKPKTTVNLLLDDNSVSTASYSDRDDFDFGSMSCDDEVSDKTLNGKNLKSNSSDSNSSRTTAKTFENKSLIMGRIFKNASTKAKVPVKSVGVQKDHPQPKADLDQLFDELRAEGVSKTKAMEIPVRKDNSIIVYEEICQEVKAPPATEIPSPEPKRKVKSVLKKQKVIKKPQKDYIKLQSELGMSQEEIEKLIDDGQRKSKRRCATNRSKKLVEMWSSDEYEEFLSTKDIIALIEEKEKQEQRKKRKSTANIATNVEIDKFREMPTTTTATVMNEITVTSIKKTSRSHFSTEERIEQKQKTASAAVSSKLMRKEKHKPPANQLTNETALKVNTWMKLPEESTNISKASKTKNNKNTRQASNKGHKDVEVPEKVVAAKIEAAAVNSLAPKVNEHNLCLLDMKQHQNNNNSTSRSNKTKKDKSVKEDVNSFKSQNRKTAKDVTDLKKRNSIGNNNKKNKSKRKPQTEKSLTRKRQASEKLYYWSSSSDEDFGRINDNEPELESSEQYQKHGWIVGDSHKKLVTLLAIAKGNKKVESCGVKKNVSKRKS